MPFPTFFVKKHGFLCWGLCVWLGMTACPSKHAATGRNPSTQESPTSRQAMLTNTQSTMTLIVPEKPVVLGQSLTVTVKNTGTVPYEYNFPGGSNGCVLPIYRVFLQHTDGQIYQDIYDGPGRLCTQAIVAPQTITIAAGMSMPIRVETGKAWYTRPDSLIARPKRIILRPGSYRVWVKGGRLQLSATGLQLLSSSPASP